MNHSSPKLLYVVALDSYFCSHRLSHALAAQKAGYEVHLATTVTSCEKILQENAIHVWPLKHLKRGQAKGVQDLKAIYELYKLFRKLQPHIVHDVAMKPVLFGAIAGKFAGIKNHLHALGGLGYLFISPKLKTKFLRAVVTLLWKLFLRGKYKRMIVQNQDDFDVFIKHKILPKKNLVLIPGSGVDTNHFKPSEKHNEIPIIICGARMLWDKGIGELVEAAKRLHQDGSDFELWLCGDNDPENPASITKEVLKKWNEEPFIQWKGHVKDMAEVYNKADIAVLPSYREGLPKTLLEAASCGLPIVTTDVPGCRDVVTDRNGLLVPAKNSEELAEALKIYLESPLKQQEDGQRSRQMVMKKFAQEKIITMIMDIYKALEEK